MRKGIMPLPSDPVVKRTKVRRLKIRKPVRLP